MASFPKSPRFAQKVLDAGATWVGPNPKALVDLGDKITARRVATFAKVPPVPGISQSISDMRLLLDFAHTHGYPLMLKRTDGGGGRGITLVHNDDELRGFYMNHDALQGGDLDEYFVERFIDKGRHVETQCGRDSHGNFTVYSTRDCSVQRRNQKLVEEAPAPFLPDGVLEQLETYSRRLFEAVDYVGLGTCEFMVTEQGKVYFLEVNPASAGGTHRQRRGLRPRSGARTAHHRQRRRADRRPPAARTQLRTASDLRGSGQEPRAELRHADQARSGRPARASASIPAWWKATPSPRSSIR